MDISSASGSGQEVLNTSLTCAAAGLGNITGSPLPDPVDIIVRGFLAVYSVILSILGLLLNGLIVYMVCKFKKLRTASFAIAAQVATANLVLALFRGFLIFVNQIAGRWVFGLHLCLITGFIVISISIVRAHLVFAFFVHRFVSVFWPFFYLKHTHRVVITLSALAWSVSMIFHLVGTLPFMDCFTYSEPVRFCRVSPSCHKNCKFYYYFGVATIYIPPVLLPTVLLTLLYLKGRKIHRAENYLAKSVGMIICDQEQRAMKTFLLLLTSVFVVTIVPISLYNVAEYTGKIARSLLYKLVIVMVVSTVVTDAIIITKNADVKECFGILWNQLKKKFHEPSKEDHIN